MKWWTFWTRNPVRNWTFMRRSRAWRWTWSAAVLWPCTWTVSGIRKWIEWIISVRNFIWSATDFSTAWDFGSRAESIPFGSESSCGPFGLFSRPPLRLTDALPLCSVAQADQIRPGPLARRDPAPAEPSGRSRSSGRSSTVDGSIRRWPEERRSAQWRWNHLERLRLPPGRIRDHVHGPFVRLPLPEPPSRSPGADLWGTRISGTAAELRGHGWAPLPGTSHFRIHAPLSTCSSVSFRQILLMRMKINRFIPQIRVAWV